MQLYLTMHIMIFSFYHMHIIAACLYDAQNADNKWHFKNSMTGIIANNNIVTSPRNQNFDCW